MKAFLLEFFIGLILVKNSVEFSNSDCGIINTNPITDPIPGKIVGGYDVGYYKYPWFVGLQAKYGKIFSCGGTLITRQHVLSAAHCFVPNYQPPEKIYDYYLGVTDNCKREEHKDRIKKFTSKSVVVHEKYSKDGVVYDIALITLDEKAYEFTPICLPFKVSLPRISREALIIGYGLRIPDNSSSLACELQEARILIYPYSTCESMLEGHEIKTEHKDTLICAGYIKGTIDSCQGDSGGPLQIMGQNNRMILKGITSFGWGCAEEDSLGFYTDVSKYMNWIVSKVNGPKYPGYYTNYWPYSYYQYLQWFQQPKNVD
ncbi:plasma kallikrein-like [Chrysoperla carnea]|uniref:plasma kallikrein-like n=1 Tax=Chrysoperla carnea TaxID=189513 RepID=UPI001D07E90C|nr:plasma kallikrein-like [Chrysoperla carnea]